MAEQGTVSEMSDEQLRLMFEQLTKEGEVHPEVIDMGSEILLESIRMQLKQRGYTVEREYMWFKDGEKIQ